MGALTLPTPADVAESVDALVSGTSGSNAMGVQVSPSALLITIDPGLGSGTAGKGWRVAIAITARQQCGTPAAWSREQEQVIARRLRAATMQ